MVHTLPATPTHACDDSIAYQSLTDEDRAARSQRHCLPTGGGLGDRRPAATRGDNGRSRAACRYCAAPSGRSLPPH